MKAELGLPLTKTSQIKFGLSERLFDWRLRIACLAWNSLHRPLKIDAVLDSAGRRLLFLVIVLHRGQTIWCYDEAPGTAETEGQIIPEMIAFRAAAASLVEHRHGVNFDNALGLVRIFFVLAAATRYCRECASTQDAWEGNKFHDSIAKQLHPSGEAGGTRIKRDGQG